MITAAAHRRSAGFSLIEMAIVLAIIGFVLGGMLLTLSAQVNQRNIDETQNRLRQARDALIGFAIANGRLPCPATAASNGVESPAGGGSACTNSYSGFLPAVTIGFQPVNSSGLAVDAWNNPIRYAVARNVTGCVSATTGLAATPAFSPFIASLASGNSLKAYGVSCQPNDLVICQSASGTLPGANPPSCNTAAPVTNQQTVVAIVFSTGKDFATPTAGNTDEQANLDGNPLYVSHPPAPPGAAGGEFDDQFEWIPVGLLYGRMTAAGVLP